MSVHAIKCRKSGKVLAVSIGGGQCVCPEGQCSEESYHNPNAAQTTDFFDTRRNSVPKPAPASRSPTKGVDRILAPFTAAQVVALDAYQQSWRYHPFTCPNRGDGKHGTTEMLHELALVPTTSVHGWICPYCDYTQGWAHPFMAEPHPPNPVLISPEMIKHMADRFLGWKLPAGFHPDAGITFKAEYNEHTAHPMKHEPTGTNLFDATQAYAMVQHMVSGGLPPPVGLPFTHDHVAAGNEEVTPLPLQEAIQLRTAAEIEAERLAAKAAVVTAIRSLPGFDVAAEKQLMLDAAPRPGNCDLWPGCGCGTQSGPHACEGSIPEDTVP